MARLGGEPALSSRCHRCPTPVSMFRETASPLVSSPHATSIWADALAPTTRMEGSPPFQISQPFSRLCVESGLLGTL
eukprot:7689065-Pyramimonas_sp.AAC.1